MYKEFSYQTTALPQGHHSWIHFSCIIVSNMSSSVMQFVLFAVILVVPLYTFLSMTTSLWIELQLLPFYCWNLKCSEVTLPLHSSPHCRNIAFSLMQPFIFSFSSLDTCGARKFNLQSSSVVYLETRNY